MSTSPTSPPPADADNTGGIPTLSDADLAAAEAAAAASPLAPRATPTPDLPSSGNLPLTTSPLTTIPLAVPVTSAPAEPPSSISHIVDFKLSLDDANFIRWRNYFNLIFARFHTDDHIRDGSAARLSNPRWRDDDNTIVLWFFATIVGDLLDVVAPAGSTAYTIWRRLHEYFLKNEAELAMHLGQEFRAAVRGDQSINDYCRRLQGLAAALADVREPVTGRTLTLQMLDSLGKKFELQAAIIQSTVLLPTFAQARSRLVLAELALDKRARAEGAQILAVHSADDRGGDRNGGRGDRSSQGGGDRGPPGGGGAGRGGDRAALGGNRGGGRGVRGRGRGDAPGGGRGTQQPWLGYFAPMGMPFPPPRAPWIPPNSAGVLGPRPGAPTHAYPVMQPSAPPVPYSTPYSWDASAMFHSAPSYGAAFPAQAEWIMDTGASSHVTGDPGVNVVTGKWIFRHKLHPDGSLAR
nr:uncharacterized protein LOC109740715 [Aegilops tauschii subsp. strangulata]